MTTRNTDKLRREVAAHVAADTIVQRIYWDEEAERGCFIGCLAHGDKPEANEAEYGLPTMLQRIAESIFEALPSADAKRFFAALPDAVSCDGKDLSNVSWQFLAAELRSLPPQSSDIQAVIDPVITGLDLLAAGQDWPHAHARATAAAPAPAGAATAAFYAASAAADANAAEAAFYANAAVRTTAVAARAAANAAPAANARLRQRDLLLRLISEAPVQ